jgi:hypothetical protein
MKNNVLYRNGKEKKEEFNRKYSGGILLVSVHLHSHSYLYLLSVKTVQNSASTSAIFLQYASFIRSFVNNIA